MGFLSRCERANRISAQDTNKTGEIFDMGVDAKHSYRFQFLKSEHWEGTRKIALARKHARCEICGEENWSNDVHHVRYRKDLTKHCWSDFKVLCRGCHGIVHFVMEHRKKMGAKDNHQRKWRNIQRSALRIYKLSEQVGPEVAIATFQSMYNEIEFNRAL